MNHPEGIEPPFKTVASCEGHKAYGDDFFYEITKYNQHSLYSASKASSDHFVRAYHETYGMPTIVTNCSNNYGHTSFLRSLYLYLISATANHFRYTAKARTSSTGSLLRTMQELLTRFFMRALSTRPTISEASMSGKILTSSHI